MRDSQSVAELAGKIKALRESVTVEATPERVVRQAARAETPVAARIGARRREPVAEVIELPVKAEEKPPAIMPAMYRERAPEHAQRVTQRREVGGQLRLSYTLPSY